MATKGNPSLRLAFRFIKERVIAENNTMPAPNWAGFDQHDTFDSVLTGDSRRVRGTPDGNSEVTCTVSFLLEDAVVAFVMLDGVQSWNDTIWWVTRVIYRQSWQPGDNATGTMLDFDVDPETNKITVHRPTLAFA